jgi:diguanylate cyclase (GGDEF)-like protein
VRRFSFIARRSAEPPRGVGTALLLVAIFGGLACIMRLMSIHIDQFAMFWPANGALVVAMLILPYRTCLAVALLCILINIGLNLLTNYSIIDSLSLPAFNVFVSYLTAVLTRWLCGATTDLSRLRRLAMFAPIAFLSAGAEASLAESIFPFSASMPALLHDGIQWALCDGLGLLLSTPAILLSFKNYRGVDQYAARTAERWALLGGTALFTVASFLFLEPPFFLLLFPIFILTAFRAGPAWVLSSILITALITSGLTAHGHGPFAILSMGNVTRSQDLLQMFLVSIVLTAVPANNALGEKARTARRLMHLKSRLEHSATHDPLTGLANRSLFKVRLNHLLVNSTHCAVLFVDLDRFKQVNDTMGHAAGDELLRSFSMRLQAVTTGAMMAARFGGDEFAILIEGPLNEADQDKLCRRINDAARAPFSLERGVAHVSASIGLALAPETGADVSELMRRADIALYAAKATRKEGYRVYDDDLDQAVRDKSSIEADLRAAVQADGQLRLHYQPKIGVDNTIRGVEALVRWQHPVHGLIPLNQLIALAEETGLIIPLGDWVLREALAFAGRWPHLNVAVNVSPAQLRHGNFIADVLQAYQAAPVAYGRLELEVTETALMHDINVVSGKLATLRSAGIRIALDDFGTGYSSLRHLHRCAVDRVKIDQSFVQGLDGGNEAAAIVKAIIQMGHAMGLQVTAEGVETPAQRRFLIEAGVDELQGFLISKPLEEAAFKILMRDGRGAGASGPPGKYTVLAGGLGG